MQPAHISCVTAISQNGSCGGSIGGGSSGGGSSGGGSSGGDLASQSSNLRHPITDSVGLASGGPVSLIAPASLESTVAEAVGNQISELLSNHMTCPVCHDWLLASHTLSCGHMFCGMCLATWLTHKHSCPSCRNILTGMPVRCLQIDNTINDLAHTIMSPATRMERKRKQLQWDDMSALITQGWASSLQHTRLQQQQATADTAAARQPPRQQDVADAGPPPHGGSARQSGPAALGAGAGRVRGTNVTLQLQQAVQQGLQSSRQPFANVSTTTRRGSASGVR
ncbi:MAG: hypothetical protein WDW36_001774 [Sanguina aurantia]